MPVVLLRRDAQDSASGRESVREVPVAAPAQAADERAGKINRRRAVRRLPDHLSHWNDAATDGSEARAARPGVIALVAFSRHRACALPTVRSICHAGCE